MSYQSSEAALAGSHNTSFRGVSALPATADVGDQVQANATRRAIIGHHRQWLNCSMERRNRFRRAWSVKPRPIGSGKF
jgi:hypothetical protein